MTVKEKAKKMKQVSPLLAASPIRERNYALSLIAESLRNHAGEIFAANKADIRAAKNLGLAEPVIKRMTFNESKLNSALDGIFGLIELPDPVGRQLLHRQLDRDLELYRITCPIGVIGVIFEARPDALVQISSLCIKSGNCALLKSGHETVETNRILFNIINTAVIKSGLPEGCLVHAEERSEISELLECDESVDLIIPRGSNSFVRYIMDNTRIPVMGHSDGVCHIYVSRNANTEKAIKIITDAKTQYVAVCNAVESVLIDESIKDSFMPQLEKAMADAHVELIKEPADPHTEYLDYKLSVYTVKDLDAAIGHINLYGSHHTDCIITEDDEETEKFMQLVDSANVYRNCSTRFADGFRYGFGAEVGISTGKLHARGPVGLEGLVTYKYRLYGNGHIVADYAEGRRMFDFKDM